MFYVGLVLCLMGMMIAVAGRHYPYIDYVPEVAKIIAAVSGVLVITGLIMVYYGRV